MKRTTVVIVLCGVALAFGAGRAEAEAIFLAKQHTRCATCHYSPAGGGLLTPYGRSLSREELSTTGKSQPGKAAQGGEQALLWGALGESLGPVSLGFDVRPSHLGVDFVGGSATRDFLMNADLLAAYRKNGWTAYGELGRQPRSSGTKIDSYEHWVGYQAEKGFGFRLGRLLPAYGIHLADHTAFTRAALGLDSFDQVYGLELSHTTERRFLQLTLAPGRADSILHDDGRRAFTAAGRFQFDVSPKSVLVVSGLFRDGARLQARNGAAGVAFGFAPIKRLSVWTEADALFHEGTSGLPAYTFFNETGFEVYRGVWLKFSPQLRTEFGRASAGVFRSAFELNLLPRTHWNVGLSYYRDQDRTSHLVTKTWLAQLHLYL